ncbi:MAG: hypothetical protein NVS3B28_12930 [Candidatus Velthaea sp.]
MSLFVELAVRGLLLGAIYGLLALPMSLIYSTALTMDFAIGAYALVAAAVGATFGGVFGIVAGLLAAVVCAAIMAAVFAVLKRTGNEDPISVALSSFGLAVALGSFVLWHWGTKAFVLQTFDTFWNMGGIRINPQGAINIGVGVMLVVILYAVLYSTDIGRMMRAAAVNPRGAELAGIPVIAVQVGTILAGGLLGGLAGILILYTSGLDFTAGLGLTLSGFAAAIVFGMQGPVRGFLGGLALGVVEALATGYGSSAISGAMPMTFVLLVLLLGRFGAPALSGDRP